MPLGEPVDSLRDMATACTLVGGIALLLVRLRVEQRVGEQANQRLRLLATACEQAGELILIARGTQISMRTTPSAAASATRPKSSKV